MENDRKFSDVQPKMQEFLRQYSPQGIAHDAESFILSHEPQGILEPVLPQLDVKPAVLTNVFYKQFFNEYEELEKTQSPVHPLSKRVSNFCEYFKIWREHTSYDYYAESTKTSVQAGDIITSLSLEGAYNFASEQHEMVKNKSNSLDYSQNEQLEYAKRTALWKKRMDISHWGHVKENKLNHPKR